MYNFRNNSDIKNTLGAIMFAVGLVGICTFLIVNAKTIISLFTI